MFTRKFFQLVIKQSPRLCCQNIPHTLLDNAKIFPRVLPFSQLNTLNGYHASKVNTAVEDKEAPNLSEILEQMKINCEKDLSDNKVFAIVHVAGKQFKVTNNDVIMTNNKIEAGCGDLIRLEKVLAVGGKTFTLVGQPILKRDLVNVQAMVMEKTKGEKKIAFKKKRRKGYKRWKGHRQDLSVLKIKSIEFDTSVL